MAERIETVKATQNTGKRQYDEGIDVIYFVFSKEVLSENGRRVRKMTAHCTRPHFHHLVDTYMTLLVSFCFSVHLELVRRSLQYRTRFLFV